MTEVCLIPEDSDPALQLQPSGLEIIGEKGYRMARGSHGVSEGDWYFEIRFLPQKYPFPPHPLAHAARILRQRQAQDKIRNTAVYIPGREHPVRERPEKEEFIHPGHVRVGWCTASGDLRAPVGYDMHGYGYRDVRGSKVHQANTAAYGEPWGPGDVIGCFISLPPDTQQSSLHSSDQKVLQDLLENSEFDSETQGKSFVLPGSYIKFYKNGVSQGIAFEHLFQGPYFPAVSLYMGARVQINFGPNFEFPPSDLSHGPSHPDDGGGTMDSPSVESDTRQPNGASNTPETKGKNDGDDDEDEGKKGDDAKEEDRNASESSSPPPMVGSKRKQMDTEDEAIPGRRRTSPKRSKTLEQNSSSSSSPSSPSLQGKDDVKNEETQDKKKKKEKNDDDDDDDDDGSNGDHHAEGDAAAGTNEERTEEKEATERSGEMGEGDVPELRIPAPWEGSVLEQCFRDTVLVLNPQLSNRLSGEDRRKLSAAIAARQRSVQEERRTKPLTRNLSSSSSKS